MVNNITIPETSKSESQPKIEKIVVAPNLATQSPKTIEIEEKVEVLIKESIRINPRDFSAFKHALEDFVNSWDK